MGTKPQKSVETFPNPYPGRDYLIRMDCPEFTSVCPMTGQPDFGRILIVYIADRRCIELKSLKLYLWSYRNQGIFYERATNKILEDLVHAIRPRWMRVSGHFSVRGGISTDVIATYRKRGFRGDPESAG